MSPLVATFEVAFTASPGVLPQTVFGDPWLHALGLPHKLGYQLTHETQGQDHESSTNSLAWRAAYPCRKGQQPVSQDRLLMRSLREAPSWVATELDSLLTRCLFVSASLATRVDQLVEMTAKIGIPTMSVTLIIVPAGKNARTSRFSSDAVSKQGEGTCTCCASGAVSKVDTEAH